MSNRQSPSRILIVDDHPMVREGIAMRISSHCDLEVCGEAATECEALQLVGETSPDLVIVDISLKSGHGISLIKQVKARHPRVKVLVFSGFQESLYAERALRAGAMGYLNKQEANDKVIEAIRTVLKGERYVSSNITGRLAAQALDTQEEDKDPLARLTNRELEIFRMIGGGQTSGAIAETLHLSRHTIDTHRENLKRKLGAKDSGKLSCQAVQWVLENG